MVPGYIREEFETFRLPLAERGEMTNEFIRIMIQAWTSEAATFEGTYYSCQDIDAAEVIPQFT